MEWIERWNEALDEIEARLTDEIDPEALARTAGCSVYHFQRMFSYLAGMPLSEYIRRRRMSLAAVDLLGGEERVMDLALKYGYSSPTAFNRAFQSVHGFPPSQARAPGTVVKSFPAIRFTVAVRGAAPMEYRIEKRDAFQIVGVSAPLDSDLEKNFEVVPSLWDRAVRDGTISRLASLMEGPPAGLLGVSACSGEVWRYFIAVTSRQQAEGLETFVVPAATWAVFPGQGTNVSLQELERRAVTEWLPTSGYEYGDAPDVEVYLNADPANARYEVWIPVVKR